MDFFMGLGVKDGCGIDFESRVFCMLLLAMALGEEDEACMFEGDVVDDVVLVQYSPIDK